MMLKLSQIKTKFFKFLPKEPVASVAFQNPNMSPSRTIAGRACRSPARKVSIIPKEARRKHRSVSFSAQEPSSPKVSCIGQVHCKKRKAKKQKRVVQPATKTSDSVNPCPEKQEKIQLWIFKGSDGGPKQSGKAFVLEEKAPATEEAPSLCNMKKFASGRESLCDFDFTLAERL